MQDAIDRIVGIVNVNCTVDYNVVCVAHLLKINLQSKNSTYLVNRKRTTWQTFMPTRDRGVTEPRGDLE